MNYEQKYKAALEFFKHIYPNIGGELKEQIENLFPELKESEDEKIRKWLEETIESMSDNNIIFNDVRRIDVLHWLEKQGEPFNDNIITRDDEILQAISIGLTDAEKYLGWSDFGGLPIEEIQDWLEKQGEQKPMWSEEDDKRQISITEYLNELYDDNRFTLNELTDLETWLNSLKQRMEEQQ